MNKLEKKLLTVMDGHDLEDVCEVAKEFAVRFSCFCADYTYERNYGKWYKSFPIVNFPEYFTTEELLNIYLEQYETEI